MPDPEARLAAALEARKIVKWSGIDPLTIDTDYQHVAHVILAADPTLAADLALAAAVQRLPESGEEAIWLTRDVRGRWEAQVVYPLSGKPKQASGFAPTLTAAIEEALRHD